eukprot:gene23726-9279_t
MPIRENDAALRYTSDPSFRKWVHQGSLQMKQQPVKVAAVPKPVVARPELTDDPPSPPDPKRTRRGKREKEHKKLISDDMLTSGIFVGRFRSKRFPSR